MKILQVITSLAAGGAETLITDLSEQLRRRGHEVDVVAFRGGASPLKRHLEAAGCRVVELGRSVYNPLYILKLRRLMRGYDIVHTHNSAAQLFAALAAPRAALRRKSARQAAQDALEPAAASAPASGSSKLAADKSDVVAGGSDVPTAGKSRPMLCTTEHSTNNRRRTWKWYRPIDRWMYRRYATIICISQAAERNLRAHLGESLARIVTIPNGIDLARFQSAQPQPTLRKHAERFVVVMVAAFRKAKDYETVVRALARLPRGAFELWFVGDGERRPLVAQLAQDLGVADEVRFFGVRTDVPEILHTADAVCLSSHWEGLSLSSVEGMAAGKPFIAADVQGLRDVVSGAGILFPHQDDAALADIIRRLAADKAYAADVARRCSERATHYDISRTVEGYEREYKALMGES